MPAPTLAALLDIETQIETAVVALLTTASLPGIRTDNVVTLETPRIEVVASVIQQGPHETRVASGSLAGRQVYDQFRVAIGVSLVATPTNGQQLGSLRGQLRAVLFAIDPATLNAQLSYLYVAINSWRMSLGARVVVEGDEGAIRQAGTVEAEVFVLPAAWPA